MQESKDQAMSLHKQAFDLKNENDSLKSQLSRNSIEIAQMKTEIEAWAHLLCHAPSCVACTSGVQQPGRQPKLPSAGCRCETRE